MKEKFSLAQRVTYNYYVGRKAMFEGNFNEGELKAKAYLKLNDFLFFFDVEVTGKIKLHSFVNQDILW